MGEHGEGDEMSERDSDERTEQHRPRIKVTDKRRVRIDEPGARPVPDAAADAMPAEPRDDVEPTDELERARREAAEYREHLQRLAADFDNYRKRVLKEQTRSVEMASEPLVRKLLEVLDDFDLALMAAEQRPDFDKFLHGVELVYAKLQDALHGEGVERIDAAGKPFDPALHEALMQSGDGEGDGEADPIVADVLRQGYTLRGRVIRPAGVRVVRR